MSAQRVMSDRALAAKCIRQELKKAFPLVKFSVTSRSYSMGNSVDVSWDNGPSESVVEEITNKYQYGHFNGMEDIYENSNRRDDIPQAMYVMTRRNISDSIYLECFEYVKKHYSEIKNSKIVSMSEWVNLNGHGSTGREYVGQFLNKMDLTNGFDKELM